MALKLDSRQTRQRTKLDQLSTTTDLRLDAIMNLINDELTMPLRMRANLGSGVDGSPDQRLYIDSIFVKTLDSGAADSGHERSRTIPPIGGVLPNYSGSGYIEFNDTTGVATASGLTLAGSYSLPSMTNGQFVKVLVWLSATSASVFTFGMEIGVPAASVDAAVLPVPPSDAFALGYVVMTKGATTYSKVLNENIFQFVGGGGSGGGSGASKEITQANSFAVGDVVYYNGTAYAKAQANTAAAAEAIGIVSKASASKFTLTELGYVTGLSALTPGEVYFLSGSVAGGLTVTEPSTIGHISKPMLIADSATSGYVLNYRGVVVGGANVRTQVSLTNNGSKNIQPVGSYDAGEMVGWVDLQNSTPANSKRFYVQIQFAKNGAGTDYNVAYQTSGDTPPAGFNVDYNSTGSYIRVTLPNISGLTTANLNYALNAPAVGTNFPLAVDGANVTAASATAQGTVTTGAQTFAGDKTFNGILSVGTTAVTGTRLRAFSPILSEFALSVSRPTEAYALTNGAASLYSPSGTLVSLGPNNSSTGVVGGTLIDFVARTTTDQATGAFMGVVSGSTSNGPANIVFGQRTGTSTWRENLRISEGGALTFNTFQPADSTNAQFGIRNTTNLDVQFEAGSGAVPGISGPMRISKYTTSGRSINAAGTVNVNGADYAEYMTKSGDFNLSKGDICGINAEGKLTNVFADSIAFMVKSTDPSYVGNDKWFSEPRPIDAEGNECLKDSEEYAAWFARMEEARSKVDRIAFCGQVPVNVWGANPGDYIVAVDDNGAIKGMAVSNPSFEQYMSAIGKVIAINEDGRATIIVKVS